MLTADETDDVLKFIAMLCTKQGWKAQARRMDAIRARITPATPAPIPPMPAGSILGGNFTPCAKCDTPRQCRDFDSCGRGL